jgi:hypothetical protein
MHGALNLLLSIVLIITGVLFGAAITGGPMCFLGRQMRKHNVQPRVQSVVSGLLSVILVPVMLACAFGPVLYRDSHSPSNQPVSAAALSAKKAQPVCIAESIPFSSQTAYSAAYEKGTSQVTQSGVAGARRICTLNGEQTSSTVTAEPVNEIVTYGTHQQQLCQVTLCRDGSCSFSQGRGTYSWHGGVARYY